VNSDAHLDLSKLHAFLPRVVFSFHLLNGHRFLGFQVNGLVNGAVGAVSKMRLHAVTGGREKH
jgi:hypothetical protein